MAVISKTSKELVFKDGFTVKAETVFRPIGVRFLAFNIPLECMYIVAFENDTQKQREIHISDMKFG